PSESLSRLAQCECGKPEELTPRDRPERLEERREGGGARGEAADDRAPTRERAHASDGARGLFEYPPGGDGEGVEPRAGDDHERDGGVGNPLENGAGLQAEAHTLLGCGARRAIDLRGRRRRETAVGGSPEGDVDGEPIAADEPARRVQNGDDCGGAAERQRG